MICPHCGHENIDGADACEQCLQSLVEVAAGPPSFEEETRIVQTQIAELQPPAPISIGDDRPLEEALQLMCDRRIGCVLICSAGQLVGILTERDVLLQVGAAWEGRLDQPVREFMTPNPETVTPDASVAFALHKMDIGGYRHLPVTDAAGQPTGVISIRDILRFLTQRYALAGK